LLRFRLIPLLSSRSIGAGDFSLLVDDDRARVVEPDAAALAATAGALATLLARATAWLTGRAASALPLQRSLPARPAAACLSAGGRREVDATGGESRPWLDSVARRVARRASASVRGEGGRGRLLRRAEPDAEAEVAFVSLADRAVPLEPACCRTGRARISLARSAEARDDSDTASDWFGSDASGGVVLRVVAEVFERLRWRNDWVGRLARVAVRARAIKRLIQCPKGLYSVKGAALGGQARLKGGDGLTSRSK